MILITSTGDFSFNFLFTSFLVVCQFCSLLIFLVNIIFFLVELFSFFFLCLVSALFAAGEHVSVVGDSEGRLIKANFPT